MIFFWFKKLVGIFSSPLMIFFGLIFVAWFAKKRAKPRLARYINCTAFILLTLFSLPFTSKLLVKPLETSHSWQFDPSIPVYNIAVLGCYAYPEPQWDEINRLADCSIKRVTQGILLAQHYPDAKLFFSGANSGTDKTNAQLGADLAIKLGIAAQRIQVINGTRDTHMEAQYLAHRIPRQHHSLVVTAASHLPRSLQLFREQGLNVSGVPAGYLADRIHWNSPYNYVPSHSSLQRSERAIYEYLGLLWTAIRQSTTQAL